MLESLALLGLQDQVWSPKAPAVDSPVADSEVVPAQGIPFHWPYPVTRDDCFI
ncbi:MAG: hypothetical protein ACUVRV_09260 [Cyanobacteriota bacterium]